MFTCRVCGCNEYHTTNGSWAKSDFKVCQGCSAIFQDADLFSEPEIEFVKLNEDAVVPTKANSNDTGYDVCALESCYIDPGKTMLIKTGITFNLPDGYGIQVRARSGLAKKHGIQVANGPGTIDTGYRNDCGVLLYNSSDRSFYVEKGDRIAQFVFEKIVNINIKESDTIKENGQRGLGGFGSSGV